MNQVEIYTDGACKGNPGPGGWGVLLRSGATEKELFGGELGTTNNRMELMAVIEALSALKRPCAVTLYLDSEYVRKGITEWIHGWKAKGWRTASKQPVKNVELWQRLDALVSTGGRDTQHEAGGRDDAVVGAEHGGAQPAGAVTAVLLGVAARLHRARCTTRWPKA